MGLGELLVFGSELGWSEGKRECGVPPPGLEYGSIAVLGPPLSEARGDLLQQVLSAQW